MHNNYPLAPEKPEISDNISSNYCSNIKNEYGIKIGGVNKLVLNLCNKSKYVLHYKNLQLYLSLGTKFFYYNVVLKMQTIFTTNKIKRNNHNKTWDYTNTTPITTRGSLGLNTK